MRFATGLEIETAQMMPEALFKNFLWSAQNVIQKQHQK